MNIWDEDTVSELDLVEEAQEVEQLADQQAYEPTVVQAEEEQLEEIAEESAFDLDNNESNIIYNARIRLEQAKLYEMLINHNFFEGVRVDPHAIEIVSNELKHYIVKRLEILMGLRQPAPQQTGISEDQLNHVELDFIKQLAYKGTLGKSAQAEPVASQTGGLKPLGHQRPEPSLKSMVESEPEMVEAPPEPPAPVRRRRAATQPLTYKPKAGVRKKKTSTSSRKKIASPLGKRDLSQAEIDALAREDLQSMSGRKPYEKMTAKEKKAEINRVNQAHKPKASPNMHRAPMVGSDMLASQYQIQQNRRSEAGGLISGSGDKAGNFNAMMTNLATKIAMNKD